MIAEANGYFFPIRKKYPPVDDPLAHSFVGEEVAFDEFVERVFVHAAF